MTELTFPPPLPRSVGSVQSKVGRTFLQSPAEEDDSRALEALHEKKQTCQLSLRQKVDTSFIGWMLVRTIFVFLCADGAFLQRRLSVDFFQLYFHFVFFPFPLYLLKDYLRSEVTAECACKAF
jgi:hypothetical protein